MSRIYINDKWYFRFDKDSSEPVEVRLPHTVKETPYHYFSENEYQTVSEYTKILYAPIDWSCNKVLLTFEGVGHCCEVFLNGEKIGEHKCGYTAFTIDISDEIVIGDDNELRVIVDSRESLNVPPFGNVDRKSVV